MKTAREGYHTVETMIVNCTCGTDGTPIHTSFRQCERNRRATAVMQSATNRERLPEMQHTYGRTLREWGSLTEVERQSIRDAD